MTLPHLNDSSLEHVTIHWDNRPRMFITRVEAGGIPDPDQQRIVRGFFTLGTWDDALFMAEGVHERASRSMDMRAFAYPLDAATSQRIDPALIFEGVNICDGAFEYINLSERAFTRLMAQFLDVLIKGATENQLVVTHESWWARFVTLAADIQARADQMA